MQLIPITDDLARKAADIAADHKLRGADSIYVAVAAEHGATLVTLDSEMLKKGARMVRTVTPEKWLKDMGFAGEGIFPA